MISKSPEPEAKTHPAPEAPPMTGYQSKLGGNSRYDGNDEFTKEYPRKVFSIVYGSVCAREYFAAELSPGTNYPRLF